MAEQKRYLDYSGTDELWKRIVKLCNKKINVTNADDSIVVTEGNKIAVKISQSENNLLKVKAGEGLSVESLVMHRLTFGGSQQFVYDGSRDVTVPVYEGQTN